MQKIVIAGGSGFLGDVLTNYFAEKGYKVVVLSRKHRLNTPAVEYYKWDARTLGYWTPQLEGAVALINLNGKSVDCRYNEKNKQLIYDTRLESTYILGEAIKRLKNPPKVWVNAASATIYRHAMDRDMDEETGKPVTNREVMSAIRKALHISFGVPLPTWLLHLGASLINTEPELILKSRRVVPGRLLKHNFSFRYQTIDEAIENLT